MPATVKERATAGPALAAAARPVKHEDAGADDGADAEQDQVQRAQAALEANRQLRVPPQLVHALGGEQGMGH